MDFGHHFVSILDQICLFQHNVLKINPIINETIVLQTQNYTPEQNNEALITMRKKIFGHGEKGKRRQENYRKRTTQAARKLNMENDTFFKHVNSHLNYI